MTPAAGSVPSGVHPRTPGRTCSRTQDHTGVRYSLAIAVHTLVGLAGSMPLPILGAGGEVPSRPVWVLEFYKLFP